MGADLIATLDGYSRADVDAFAVGSQQKAAAAQANGYFDKSVVPVKDHAGVTILEKDEFIKGNTTVEGLAKLNASFEMMGQMGFDAVALQKYPEAQKLITFIMQVTHQVSSMVLRWCYWLLKKQSKSRV